MTSSSPSDDHDVMMEGAYGPESTDADNLLLQFQCMGTNDRDALILEFQRLLGPINLQAEACTFFLEMNNWNLQQAINTYFECDKDMMGQQSSLPCMTLIKDVTVGDGEEVSPNTQFQKTWKILNSGSEQWPFGCGLKFLGGAQLTHQDRFPVEALNPGQSVDLSVVMTAPAVRGTYEGQWRMQTNSGMFFGEVIWVIVTVAEGGLLGLTQQMSNFHSLGSSPADRPHDYRFLRYSMSSGPPALTVTSPDYSTVDLTRPSGSTSTNHQCNNEEGMMADENVFQPPNPVRRVIDRVKESLPDNDNRENCIQICRDILTRSNSVSPSVSPNSTNGGIRMSPSDGRRGSIGCSPLVMSDGSNPLRSMSFSSPNTSSPSYHQPSMGNFDTPTSSAPSSTSRSLFNNGHHPQGPVPAVGQEEPLVNHISVGQVTEGKDNFPPTPPSEDMML